MRFPGHRAGLPSFSGAGVPRRARPGGISISSVSIPHSRGVSFVKSDIHPEYVTTQVTCACGNSFETRSTKSKIHVEICSNCHPFYTGKQKFVDSEGRVDRFNRKYNRTSN